MTYGLGYSDNVSAIMAICDKWDVNNGVMRTQRYCQRFMGLTVNEKERGGLRGPPYP